MGPDVPRADIGIGMNDMNIVHQQPEFFGHYLRHNGIRALPHVRSAGKQIDFTEIVHLNNVAAAVGFINPGTAAHMDQRGQPDPFAGSPRRIPFKGGFDRIPAIFQAAGRNAQFLGLDVPGLIGVDTTEFDQIDAGFFGQHIHGAFNCKGRLGIAVTPHRLCVRVVGINTFGLKANIGHPV